MTQRLSSGTTLVNPCLDDGALNRCTGSGEAAGPKLLSATGFTLHLPLPPSVNNMGRTKYGRPLGNSSPKVHAWKRQADICTLLQPRPEPVKGDFEIEITWDLRKYRQFDCDNRIKFLMDWLQSRELIENDKFCWDLHAHWGSAPRGCIVTVRNLFL